MKKNMKSLKSLPLNVSIRGLIVCFMTIATIMFLSIETMAFSLEAHRSVIGASTSSSSDILSTNNVDVIGIDAFIYEGQSVDIFIGGEVHDVVGRMNVSKIMGVDSRGDMHITRTVATVGFRYRFQTRGRVKHYIFLKTLYGNSNIELSKQGNIRFEHDEGAENDRKRSSLVGGFGLGYGVNIGLGTRWSMGVEGNLYFMMDERLQRTRMWQRDIGKLADVNEQGEAMPHAFIRLGLKYSF